MSLPQPPLTPTEDLLIDLLVARHRLLDTPYHLSTRHRAALRSLEAKGLIRVDSGSVEHHLRASLSAVGKALFVTDYVPPLLSPTCLSFYLGPKSGDFRIDCTRRNHHGGRHRGNWWTASTNSRGERTAEPVVVKWSNDQAGGYASARYAPGLRRADAQAAAREAAEIEAYRRTHP